METVTHSRYWVLVLTRADSGEMRDREIVSPHWRDSEVYYSEGKRVKSSEGCCGFGVVRRALGKRSRLRRL